MKARVLTISNDPSGNPKYPFIKLSGKWLKENGFTIGEKVLVESQKGNIRIRAIKFTDQEEESDCVFEVCK